MKIGAVIKEFICTLFIMAEAAGFILLIGFAGGVDQDTITVREGTVKMIITVGVMVVLGFILYLIIKDDGKF